MFRRFLELFKQKETDKSLMEQKRLSNELFNKLVQLLKNDTEYASDKDLNEIEQDISEIGGYSE
jgi:hypothetical protein